MALRDENYCCKSNALIEYVTRTVHPEDTDLEFCDPRFIETKEYICLSIEQLGRSRETEQPGISEDIVYARGRLVNPEHKKTICMLQQEFCIKFKTSDYTEAYGTARVLPEISSRFGLERIFKAAVQLEIRINNDLANLP